MGCYQQSNGTGSKAGQGKVESRARKGGKGKEGEKAKGRAGRAGHNHVAGLDLVFKGLSLV